MKRGARWVSTSLLFLYFSANFSYIHMVFLLCKFFANVSKNFFSIFYKFLVFYGHSLLYETFFFLSKAKWSICFAGNAKNHNSTLQVFAIIPLL